MARTSPSPADTWDSLADALRNFGGISPRRIRMKPPPGKATEADLIRIREREKRLYELVDGCLVEKVMGALQSCLTGDLVFAVKLYLRDNDLGFLMVPDGPTRLLKGLVRLPDLSFYALERMPDRAYPAEAIVGVAPNLAVEVLSESNTKGEMLRKLKEYFLAEVELVWVVDPYRRTVAVHTAPDHAALLSENDTLEGGTVLPGFALSLKELFARLPGDFARRSARRR